MINRISQEYIHTFSSDHFLEYILLFLDDNADEEYEQFSNSESSVSESCLAFACIFADFTLALLIKALLKRSFNIQKANACTP